MEQSNNIKINNVLNQNMVENENQEVDYSKVQERNGILERNHDSTLRIKLNRIDEEIDVEQ